VKKKEKKKTFFLHKKKKKNFFFFFFHTFTSAGCSESIAPVGPLYAACWQLSLCFSLGAKRRRGRRPATAPSTLCAFAAFSNVFLRQLPTDILRFCVVSRIQGGMDEGGQLL
jgi:hypothetical protein